MPGKNPALVETRASWAEAAKVVAEELVANSFTNPNHRGKVTVDRSKFEAQTDDLDPATIVSLVVRELDAKGYDYVITHGPSSDSSDDNTFEITIELDTL